MHPRSGNDCDGTAELGGDDQLDALLVDLYRRRRSSGGSALLEHGFGHLGPSILRLQPDGQYRHDAAPGSVWDGTLLLLPGATPLRCGQRLSPLHSPCPTAGSGRVGGGSLFSAAMSSLDSGINSVSSVVITDYYRRLRRSAASLRGEMVLARVVTVAAGVFAILTCFLLDWIPEEMRGNLFDVTGRISSFLVGSLGGMMFLAILKVRCSGRVAMGSALAGMSVGLVWAQGHWLFGLQELAWMWVIPLSTLVPLALLSPFHGCSPPGPDRALQAGSCGGVEMALKLTPDSTSSRWPSSLTPNSGWEA